MLNLPALSSIIGKCALHDGPNCFNATLLAKGQAGGLWFVSDAELKYFLKKSCDRVDGLWQYGDVLVQIGDTEKAIEHSAVYLGQDKIFEKSAYKGLTSYEIYSLKESRYYKDPKKIQIFRCRQVEETHHAGLEIKEIESLNRMISEMTFTAEPDLARLDGAIRGHLPKILSFTKSRTGKDADDLYIYAKIKSIWFSLKIIRYEFGSVCQDLLKGEPDELETAFRELKQRILKADPGAKARYILDSQ